MTFGAHNFAPPSEQRGSVVVLFAFLLPVLLLALALAIDVGNWFVHKRHLQMQADAGALAGGGVFRIPCSDAPILDETRNYAGDPGAATPYNLQLAPTQQANVHALVRG